MFQVLPAPPTRSERRRAEKEAGRRERARRVARILATLCLAAGAVLFALYLNRDPRPQVRTSPAASPTATGARLADPDLASIYLAAAASDVAAVTTYDYRTLDDALAAGLAVTTGPYRQAYDRALAGQLGATARATHAVHTFDVLRLGIGEMSADGRTAKVLVFGRQHVTDDTTDGHPGDSAITLCATMRRVGDRYLISDLAEGANAGLPPGGPELPVAAEAARSEVIALLSYRRATFDADLQRALAGAVDPLRAQIEQNAAGTRAAMDAGGYDLSAAVTSVAVERADGDSAVLLVAADSSRVSSATQPSAVSQQRYEVTVARADRGWAVSAVSPVGGT